MRGPGTGGAAGGALGGPWLPSAAGGSQGQTGGGDIGTLLPPATVPRGSAQIRGSSFSMNSFTAIISCRERTARHCRAPQRPRCAPGMGHEGSAASPQVGMGLCSLPEQVGNKCIKYISCVPHPA